MMNLTKIGLSIFFLLILSAVNMFAEEPPDYILKWDSIGSGYGQFDYPIGGTTNSSKYIYIADTNNISIQKFKTYTLEAYIEICPGVLNLKSKGKYITCYIEMLDDYDVYDIDQTMDIYLEYDGDYVIAEETPREIDDSDSNGIPDLMVKFDRQAVYDIVVPGYIDLTVKGSLIDGYYFEGFDTVFVKE